MSQYDDDDNASIPKAVRNRAVLPHNSRIQNPRTVATSSISSHTRYHGTSCRSLRAKTEEYNERNTDNGMSAARSRRGFVRGRASDLGKPPLQTTTLTELT